MNKKILAILMALLMIVVSGVAMAEDKKTEEIPVVKTFSGVHTPEDVEITVTGKEGPVNPIPTLDGITFEKVEDSANGHISISEDNFTALGTYIYEIKESAGNTSGVRYDQSKYELKVQVFVDENNDRQMNVVLKKDGDDEKPTQVDFKNVTTGQLTVTKKLVGNMVDNDDEFTIKVTIGKKINDKLIEDFPEISISKNGSLMSNVNTVVTKDECVYTFTGIKGEDSISLSNILAGVTWTVEEVKDENGKVVGSNSKREYVSQIENNSSGTIATTPTTVVVKNSCNAEIETGVTTDSLPYIMLMVIVAIAAVAFVMKKRAARE